MQGQGALPPASSLSKKKQILASVIWKIDLVPILPSIMITAFLSDRSSHPCLLTGENLDLNDSTVLCHQTWEDWESSGFGTRFSVTGNVEGKVPMVPGPNHIPE